MREWDFSQIRPQIDVWDNSGEQIGSVAHVYTAALATTGNGGTTSGESFIEVKTGLLGLGPRYYIPESAISDVTDSGVVLSVARGAIDSLGWQTKPAT